MVLDSPRESHRYQDALAALLSSDHEQKLLYTLSDRSVIERMLNILELVSVTHTHFPSARVLIPETLRPKGVTRGQFETKDEEGATEIVHPSQEDVPDTCRTTAFIHDRRGDHNQRITCPRPQQYGGRMEGSI